MVLQAHQVGGLVVRKWLSLLQSTNHVETLQMSSLTTLDQSVSDVLILHSISGIFWSKQKEMEGNYEVMT